jgi:hypothetical protein
VGGIPCLVDRNAILRFQSVPTDPAQQAEFDAQMRQLYVVVAQDIADEAAMEAKAVCDILAKAAFTQEDRQKLLTVIESLYEGYA